MNRPPYDLTGSGATTAARGSLESRSSPRGCKSFPPPPPPSAAGGGGGAGCLPHRIGFLLDPAQFDRGALDPGLANVAQPFDKAGVRVEPVTERGDAAGELVLAPLEIGDGRVELG